MGTNRMRGKALVAVGAVRRRMRMRPRGADRFRPLFEQCPVGMLVLGLDLRIENTNPRFCEMLGLPDGQIKGRNVLDVIHPDERRETARKIRRLCAGENGRIKLEKRFLRSDGSPFSAEVTAALVRDDGGAALQVVAVVEDISSRKITEAELIRSNSDLELFAAVAAHDLQEPLRKVITYVDILAKMCESLPDEGRSALIKGQSAAIRMKGLIEDLLEYARVNAVKHVSGPVDLNVVLQEVLTDLSVSAKEARLEVACLPVVDADAMQMRQLFQNLLSNAFKFTEPGRPADVKVAMELLGGKAVRIEVRDKGIGFDEKYLDRIFKPFQRVCDKNLYQGSGIGLAICKNVVLRHGGSITASSAPGQGACFRLVLPLHRSRV